MSELQKMEAPPAYDTTTSPAPTYNQTTSPTAPDTAVTVTTTAAPTASGGEQFTSIWDQVINAIIIGYIIIIVFN